MKNIPIPTTLLLINSGSKWYKLSEVQLPYGIPPDVLIVADLVVIASPFCIVKQSFIMNKFCENDIDILRMKLFAQGKTFNELPEYHSL